MVLCKLILPQWVKDADPSLKPVLEGMFSDDEINSLNDQGYSVYYLPNHPKTYTPGRPVAGSDIDTWTSVFVDMDLKDKKYPSKEAFIEKVLTQGIEPSRIVDSGNGIHVYWNLNDLTAQSCLRFQHRLIQLFSTDRSLGTLYQLMRLPGTMNTKRPDNIVECAILHETDKVYTSEELDKLLPPISLADEEKCRRHYDMVYNINQEEYSISDVLPAKFGQLLSSNAEAKALFINSGEDRSKADFRLGHLMFANGFTKDEALSVLVNSAKALQRAPIHRSNYAQNIVEKIWTFESRPDQISADIPLKAALSPTVRDILSRGEDTIKGTRFPCNKLIDDTVHGFRLGQVIGIIGGSGVGKTTLTLNAFIWFAEQNPDYHHFFFSLEQPAGEIASRIRTICNGNGSLYDKIHIISNYGEEGAFNNFSIDDIEAHLQNWEKETGKKVGACVVDHIGVLAKSDKNGENDGLIGICRKMKAVAVKTNIMLIMLSQAPREKAGIGDIELNKDAAYGTVFFESFLDYCLCLWQPLKRTYDKGAPTVMAIKFAKIRHKKQGQDRIQEDVCYQLFFDPDTELLRELTQEETKSAEFFLRTATNLRKLDRKTDMVPYQSRHVEVKNETRPNSH